jgi:hypothetical protein
VLVLACLCEDASLLRGFLETAQCGLDGLAWCNAYFHYSTLPSQGVLQHADGALAARGPKREHYHIRALPSKLAGCFWAPRRDVRFLPEEKCPPEAVHEERFHGDERYLRIDVMRVILLWNSFNPTRAYFRLRTWLN